MKKLFVFFVLSLWSIAGWAQEIISAVAPSGQTLYYQIWSTTEGNIAVIVSPISPMLPEDDPWENVTKPEGDLIIPNTVEYNGNSYPVNNIIPYAFKGCSGLTSVTIPNSVTSIGDQTFSGCTGLTSVVIPNSVTEIKIQAFSGCTGLTSVVIPNSVTKIKIQAFLGCTGLTSVVIGSSVTNIGSDAFAECSSLKTVFWLANNPPSADAFKERYMMPHDNPPDRIILSDHIFTYGSGDNTIYYVLYYFLVYVETTTESEIPYSSLPTNFICKKGVEDPWVAREIVLTDGEDAFNVPNNPDDIYPVLPFTADSVTYTRSFTNGNRSTLCLPFSAAVPEWLEVYEFSNYDNSTHTLNFAPVADSIRAYTPYLVGYGLSKAEQTTCTITATDAFFPATIAENLHPASSNGMTFQGTMERTCMNGNNYGYSNGYFVQSGNGFDHDGHAHVNPFRCYFTYNPAAGAPQNLPATLFIDCSDNSPMGIGDVETSDRQNSIRYSNDVYDLMGRLVRKNAETLEGLPRGVYIWRGEKVVRWER